MEHLSNHVICENKRNRYKEVLNKAALDKSKEIVAEEIASWSAANWMESKSLPDTKRSGGNWEKPCKESQPFCSRCVVLPIRDTGKP